MNKKEFCQKFGITEDQFSGKEKILGDLNLPSVTKIPAGFNPTVGESLYLSSVTEIPTGFNPTVGGYLDLHSVTEIPKGFNPVVGGAIITKNKNILVNTPLPFLSWREGKYVKVDGIFTEVVSHRGKVYRVKRIGNDKIFYLVTDGEKWAHGDTLKEAKADLIYKVSNHIKEDYRDLNMNSVLTFEEAVVCYRVITGACSFGVKDFVEHRLRNKKRKYTVQNIVDETVGEYGNEVFRQYFTK